MPTIPYGPHQQPYGMDHMISTLDELKYLRFIIFGDVLESFEGYQKCTWMNIDVGDSVDGKFTSTISKLFPIVGPGSAFKKALIKTPVFTENW